MKTRLIAAVAGAWLALAQASLAGQGPAAPVTVSADDSYFTLDNGIVRARIRKTDGDLHSLVFRGTEMLTDQSGRPGGHWSHDPTGGTAHFARVTIDPQDNGGARAEVSIKGISGGNKMGHGPGAAEDGDFPMDVDVRYTLGRGDAGIYTYSIFEHQPEYAAATMTEARYAIKLADIFDWLHADRLRNRLYTAPVRGEDKYVFTAVQFDNPAYGFSSTKSRRGFFFVNPTVEYLSGGPTKPEFLVHRDTTQVAAPVVLNYWRSSHYGGANVTVAAGEYWSKVVGPFLIYVNEGKDPQGLWADARAQAAKEAAKWPYAWVNAPGYATHEQRGSVSGRLVLKDPVVKKFPGRVLVGLAKADYEVTLPGGRTQQISWQTDAKHYQFWVEANSSGAFGIPDVVPGQYTLYALADGVLGEFAHADVLVTAGGEVALGDLAWQPVRRGQQLWEIGVPNRTATEFAGADRFFQPDISQQYAAQFPDDVTFTIGRSSERSDWFYAQVPHATGADARNGRASPRTIRFDLKEAPSGRAVLRLAISGAGTRTVGVAVNGQPAGHVDVGIVEGVISRRQIQGIWREREFAFDASLLKTGSNTLTLTVPEGALTAGVIYDYLRLEVER